MQRRSGTTARQRQSVLAEPSEVIVKKLRARPDDWFRIAGTDYCRTPDEHPEGCQCSVRTLTQTAHRVRRKALGAFSRVTEGCFQVVATSAANRPDRRYDVEIKARYRRCGC